MCRSRGAHALDCNAILLQTEDIAPRPIELKFTKQRVPTIEDITVRLHGYKVFTKFDALVGYWRLELTE